MALLDDMRALWVKRRALYKPILVDELPGYAHLRERCIIGSFSYTLPASAERWLVRSSAVDLGYGIMTPSEVARDYLAVKFPAKRRGYGAQVESAKKHLSAPLYARPQEIESAAYVDLKAAYFSILNVVGWNTEYHYRVFWGRGTPCHDFPLPDNKLARNCLVSLCLPGKLVVWDGRKLSVRAVGSAHINMCLYACVMDVLHAIANEALALGACYVHTDGYILDADAAPYLIAAIAGYGLVAAVKHAGKASVTGYGRYVVGDAHTRHLTYASVGYLNRVRKMDTAWIRPRFHRMSQGRLDRPVRR